MSIHTLDPPSKWSVNAFNSPLLFFYLEEGVLRLMDEQAGRHPPIKPEERRGRPEAVHSQNLKKDIRK